MVLRRDKAVSTAAVVVEVLEIVVSVSYVPEVLSDAVAVGYVDDAVAWDGAVDLHDHHERVESVGDEEGGRGSGFYWQEGWDEPDEAGCAEGDEFEEKG